MSDHSHFEELAALEAGGFLSDEELIELHKHTEACDECREAEEEFNSLVHFGLPLTVGPVREFMDEAKTRPDDNMRPRFLRRARLEGIAFSPDVDEPTGYHRRRIGFFAASGAALITAVVVISVFHGAYRQNSHGSSQAQQQIDQLKQENAALTANLSRSSESLAADQREIQNLHIHLENASTTAENLRRNGEQARDAERASSLNAQSQDESRNNEKLLAQAKDEAAHANQLRNNDIASLVEQQARITELSDKLRVASATLDLERQLTAEGKDIRELMAARQLHVIDVRDTDPNGNPGKAFGRLIVAEGKSLTFYAFDLNETKGTDAKRNFQVWAAPDTGTNSARSLGFLHVDAKAQGRWVLKVDDPELVKKLNSVYVTAEPAAGSKQASGQKMLYAYLGEANHP
jgi:hypothetical protein